MIEMQDWEIDAKHRRIRKSDELKYPGNRERCLKTCGEFHCEVKTPQGRAWIAHRCFLAVDHELGCEFSSECATSRVEVVSNVAA
jgi:hypothetical protein